MRIPRPKLNYANVIATIALFVALGGAAVAAGLPRNSVGTNQLKRGAVSAAKLKRGAVTAGKIAPKAVVAGKLGANAVLPGNLGNGIITTNKLSDSSVIASKIKNGAVTTNKLNNGAVTTAKLGDGSVTLGKLADTVPPLLGTLKSGQTLRGVFALGGEDKITPDSVTFQFPLVNPPAASKDNVLDVSKTNANCPGITGTATPQANPGQLCVYITSKSAEFEGLEFIDGATNRLGFGLAAGFKLADPANLVYGQWAVTAP
ncbi:MAG: hypothetical protein E6G51_07310 [Actinobacteria bacterium]|nr:MAG: hypothetical protein E6G51_07310 [Actinomycetota bacterium]